MLAAAMQMGGGSHYLFKSISYRIIILSKLASPSSAFLPPTTFSLASCPLKRSAIKLTRSISSSVPKSLKDSCHYRHSNNSSFKFLLAGATRGINFCRRYHTSCRLNFKISPAESTVRMDAQAAVETAEEEIVLTQTKKFKNVGEFASFFKNIDAVMFDCDGVLWLGPKILPKAPELVKKLRVLGKKVFFMTNNSTKTREEFMKKFNSLGFEASMDEIVSTSYLAALYLKELGFSKKVYAIGTTGLTQELEAVGIPVLPIGPDVISPESTTWSSNYLEKYSLDPEVGAVIVGFDQHFSYAKLFKAASYLNDPKCIFVATNTDESFPSGGKMVIPGTGSIVVSVKTAAQREPVIMGKPSRIPFDYVQRRHNLNPSRVLMVGDRGNTDILFGKVCGLHTLLVLTGVTSISDVQSWEKSSVEEEQNCVPNYYMKDVAEFYSFVRRTSDSSESAQEAA